MKPLSYTVMIITTLFMLLAFSLIIVLSKNVEKNQYIKQQWLLY